MAGESSQDVALLASLLPSPSTFSLLNELPDACSKILKKRSRKTELAENNYEETQLLVSAFREAKAFVFGFGFDFDSRVHSLIVGLVVELLADRMVRDEVVFTTKEITALDLLSLVRVKNFSSSKNICSWKCASLWVAHLMFKGARTILAVVGNDDDSDLALVESMTLYLSVLPLEMLREIDLRFVHRKMIHYLRSREAANSILLQASLVFLASPILKRNLDGIDLLKQAQPDIDWLRDHCLPQVIFGKKGMQAGAKGQSGRGGNGSIHPEVIDRAGDLIVRMAAIRSLLKNDDIKLIARVSPPLLENVLRVFNADSKDLIWVLTEVYEMYEMEILERDILARTVHAVSKRLEISEELARLCADYLWSLDEPFRLAEAVFWHAVFSKDKELLVDFATRCLYSLDVGPNFSQHVFLSSTLEIWEKQSDQTVANYLREEKIADKWIIGVSKVLAQAKDETTEFPNLSHALQLAARILAFIYPKDSYPLEQRHFVLAVWTLFDEFLLERNQEVMNTVFDWIARICAADLLTQQAIDDLYGEKVSQYMDFIDSTAVPSTAYSEECFKMVRELFFRINKTNFKIAMERSARKESAGKYFDENSSQNGTVSKQLESKLDLTDGFLVPICSTDELKGLKDLWRISIQAADENVASPAIAFLQFLYDPVYHASMDNSEILRARSDYVERCIENMSTVLSSANESFHCDENAKSRALLRCMHFIDAILDDAATHGTRGFRAHGAISDGVSVHNIKAIQKGAEYLGSAKELCFMVFGAATVWDLRCIIEKKAFRDLKQRPRASRVAIEWVQRSETKTKSLGCSGWSSNAIELLPERRNSETLKRLGFGENETVRFYIINHIEEMQTAPCVRLLNADGSNLSDSAIVAFKSIFDEWASKKLEFSDSESIDVMTKDNLIDLFRFVMHTEGKKVSAKAAGRRARNILLRYSTLKGQNYLRCEDFLSFYFEAVKTRQGSVWADLSVLGFDLRLRRYDIEDGRVTSEFRMSRLLEGDRIATNAPNRSSRISSTNSFSQSSLGWRAILCDNQKLFRILFLLLDQDNEFVSTTAWAILLRLPTFTKVTEGLKNMDFDSFIDANASWRRTLYSLHIIVSLLQKDESQCFAAQMRTSQSDANRRKSDSHRNSIIQSHYPDMNYQNSSLSEYTMEIAQWTSEFIRAGGIQLLIELMDFENDSHPELIEECLKAVKLCVKFLRFKNVNTLEPSCELQFLNLESVSRLMNCLCRVVEGCFRRPADVTFCGAQNALFIYDALAQWTHALSEDGIVSTALHIIDITHAIEVEAVSSFGNVRNNLTDQISTKSNAKRQLDDIILKTIFRSCHLFPSLRDAYLERFVERQKLTSHCGLNQWQLKVMSQLLTMEPRSRYLPPSKQNYKRLSLTKLSMLKQKHSIELVNFNGADSAQEMPKDYGNTDGLSSSFDDDLLQTFALSVSSGYVASCIVLKTVIDAAPETLNYLDQYTIGLDSIVTQLSHRLLYSASVHDQINMVDLLATISDHKPLSAIQVAKVSLIPLFRQQLSSIGGKGGKCKVESKNRKSLSQSMRLSIDSTTNVYGADLEDFDKETVFSAASRNHVGLVNLGSTCSINSVLQQIANIPSLVQLVFDASLQNEVRTARRAVGTRKISDEMEPSSKHKKLSNILSELKTTIAFLCRSERETYNPIRLLSDALNVNLKEPQDCEEFFNRLSGILQDTCSTQLWSEVFGGMFKTCRTCEYCGADTSVFNQVGSHVALDIDGLESVTEGFEKRFAAEKLDDYRCPKCHEIGVVQQTSSFEFVPDVLIVHLKRFRYNMNRGREKLEHVVRFEDSLYGRRLVGILCHRGSVDSGHCYSYVRSLQHNSVHGSLSDIREPWFEVNDTLVRRLDSFPAESFESGYLLFFADPTKMSSPKNISKDLVAKVDRDNKSFRADLLFQQSAFWRLDLAVLKSLHVFVVVNNLNKRPQSTINEPSWWPASHDRPSNDENIPDAADSICIQMKQKQSAEPAELLSTFCLCLSKALCSKDIIDDGETHQNGMELAALGIFDILSRMCYDDIDLTAALVKTIGDASLYGKLACRAWYFVVSLLRSGLNDEDTLSDRQQMFCAGFITEHFLETAMHIVMKGNSDARSYAATAVALIVHFAFVSVPADVAPNSNHIDALDWAFSSHRSVIPSLLKVLLEDVERGLSNFDTATGSDVLGPEIPRKKGISGAQMDLEMYILTANRLASLSVNCAERTAYSLADMVVSFRSKGKLQNASSVALRSVLLIDDLYSESRMAQIVQPGCRDLNDRSHGAAPFLGEILGCFQEETSNAFKVFLQVVDTPSTIIYIFHNKDNESTIRVTFRFINKSREVCGADELFGYRPMHIGIKAGDYRVIWSLKKTQLMKKDRYLPSYEWSCESMREISACRRLSAVPGPRPSALHEPEHSNKEKILDRRDSDGAAKENDDFVNGSHVAISLRPTELKIGGYRISECAKRFPNEYSAIKAMGFCDEEAIQRALLLSNGNQERAVEVLLEDSFYNMAV